MTPICAVDTETTSLRPDRRAWEIGVIRRDENGERDCQFFVALPDIDLPEADPFSLDVGRFWGRHPDAAAVAAGNGSVWTSGSQAGWDLHPENGRTAWNVPDGAVLDACDAAAVVAAWTHRAHLVGMVPNFDAEVLAALLRDNNLTPTWHHHLTDVGTLAVGWLAGQVVADAEGRGIHRETGLALLREDFALPWKSDDVSRAVGVEPPGDDERHTALGDARWAQRIYDRVFGGVA